jgi:hypothetical protein
MPPDGGGKGHFTTLAEIRAAIADHDRRLAMLEHALYSALTELAATVGFLFFTIVGSGEDLEAAAAAQQL